MQPDHGGRFALRLIETNSEQAHFEAALTTSEGSWETDVTVQLGDGSVAWKHRETAALPPEWLLDGARAALRTAWRQHQEQGWPRRITRWRAAPDPKRRGGQ
jgi:hypothetical protein